MQFLQAGGHPEALVVDSVQSAPVDRRRASPQRLIYAVTESHPHNKREAVSQSQPDLHPGSAILGSRVRRSGASNWVLIQARAGGIHTATGQKTYQALHHLFELL